MEKINNYIQKNSLIELDEFETLTINGGETPAQTGKRHGEAVRKFFVDAWNSVAMWGGSASHIF